MAIVDLNTIKNWFRTAKKPTQAQFWDTWDSFFHKLEKIKIETIEGLNSILGKKVDVTQFDGHVQNTNNPHNVTAEQINAVTKQELEKEMDSRIEGDYILNQEIDKINESKGQPNGIASLDSSGKVPAEQLPEINGSNLSTSNLKQTEKSREYDIDSGQLYFSNGAVVLNSSSDDGEFRNAESSYNSYNTNTLMQHNPSWGGVIKSNVAQTAGSYLVSIDNGFEAINEKTRLIMGNYVGFDASRTDAQGKTSSSFSHGSSGVDMNTESGQYSNNFKISGDVIKLHTITNQGDFKRENLIEGHWDGLRVYSRKTDNGETVLNNFTIDANLILPSVSPTNDNNIKLLVLLPDNSVKCIDMATLKALLGL